MAPLGARYGSKLTVSGNFIEVPRRADWEAQTPRHSNRGAILTRARGCEVFGATRLGAASGATGSKHDADPDDGTLQGRGLHARHGRPCASRRALCSRRRTKGVVGWGEGALAAPNRCRPMSWRADQRSITPFLIARASAWALCEVQIRANTRKQAIELSLSTHGCDISGSPTRNGDPEVPSPTTERFRQVRCRTSAECFAMPQLSRALGWCLLYLLEFQCRSVVFRTSKGRKETDRRAFVSHAYDLGAWLHGFGLKTRPTSLMIGKRGCRAECNDPARFVCRRWRIAAHEGLVNWESEMAFLGVALYLAVSIGCFLAAILTTEETVLNKPLAALAAIVWPVSLAVVAVAAYVSERRTIAMVRRTPAEGRILQVQ